MNMRASIFQARFPCQYPPWMSADLKLEAGQKAIFHCKSGMRTDSNCAHPGPACGWRGVYAGGGSGCLARPRLCQPPKGQPRLRWRLTARSRFTAGSLILTRCAAGMVRGARLGSVFRCLCRCRPDVCRDQWMVRNGDAAAGDAMEPTSTPPRRSNMIELTPHIIALVLLSGAICRRMFLGTFGRRWLGPWRRLC